MTPEPPTTASPPLNRQVTLALPGLEEVPARVTAKGEGFTELLLLARPRTPLLDHSQAFVEFLTDDGMWRQLGTVRLQATDHGEALRLEHRGRLQLLQRRAYVRTDCIAMVIVTPDGGAPQRGLTLNLSGGGLLVRGLSGVAAGDELAFDLRLDLLPARIQGRCRVVRATPDGYHGVQFDEIDEGDRDRLVRFAYQREKAAREARLGY
ncbi:MAG TPA: PilZ domain-containing protein [Solirubrobacteraceae bacterium]|jgi:c-di-GMP-binding flagellar brake protein YcgR